MTDSPPGPTSKAPLVGLFLYLAGLVTQTVAAELGSSIFLRPLAPVMVLLGVAIVARAGGPFHRSRIREARWKLWAAWFATAVLLGAYLTLTARASQADGFWITFLTAACLTTAATIALQTTLTSQPGLSATLASLATQLLAVAFLLLGATALTDGRWLEGLRYLLVGGALLVFGVALFTMRPLLLAIGGLLAASMPLVDGVAALADGDLLFGVPFLMYGIGGLLLSVAFLIGRFRPLGAALLVVGVGTGLGGVVILAFGDPLYGAAALVLGVTATLGGGVLLGGAATTMSPLPGIGFILVSSAFLLLGVGMLRDGRLLFSIGALLFAGAFLLGGFMRLTGHHLRDRLVRVLGYARAPAPPVAEKEDDD